MNSFRGPVACLLAAAFMLAGCGGGDEADDMSARELLPQKFQEIATERTTEVRTFVGESLWEYIDGGAEQYHEYGFKEVKTAEYTMGEKDIVVDVYEFSDATNAYGLYSVLRPDESEIINIGIEGYVAPSSVEFVKGKQVVRLIGFDESSETKALLVGTAKLVEQSVQGTLDPPPAFGLFPISLRIALTDKYLAESFMGQKVLTKFYSQDYGIEAETVTLFFTLDNVADKFQKWSELAENKSDAPSDLAFDNGKSFLYEQSWHGRILVGIKNSKLVGMTNYDDSRKEFFADWLNSLN
ncbi:MAG: DUF6599 family protein [Candidatus Zixiibacteriota bacterium]